MKHQFHHRAKRITPLLLLVPFLLGLVLVPQAHAAGITFKSFCHANTASGSTINCTLSGVSLADTIIVNIFGNGVFNGFVATDGQSNTYTEQIFSLTGNGGGASTYIYATLSAASGGSDVVTVTTGAGSPNRAYGFTASDYSGVTGFGKTGTDQQDAAGNSGTSTISLSGTGSTSAFIDDIYDRFTTAVTFTPNNFQTIRDSGSATNCASLGACEVADTTSPILGWSWSGDSGCAPCFVSHSVLELTGLSTSPSTTVFQCYGNCGNPPITLANTNSTHLTNFNQTITLFYQFQSNINGFLLNMTVNIAKTYPANNPNGPAFGVYTIPSCTTGLTPFSAQCPGQLQQTGPLGNYFPAKKGQNSLSGLHIPVFLGQWVGIGVTGASSGLDMNDTNTNVNLFQTSEGKIPPTISAGSSLGNNKLGMWAWITGNVAVSGPSGPSSGIFNCAGLLDCILPNLVNSFCALGAPSCIAASGLVWAGIFAAVFAVGTLKGANDIMPGVKLPFGELFLFFFPMWVFVMAGLSLVYVWAPLFFFFLVSIAFGKQTGHYL